MHKAMDNLVPGYISEKKCPGENFTITVQEVLTITFLYEGQIVKPPKEVFFSDRCRLVE